MDKKEYINKTDAPEKDTVYGCNKTHFWAVIIGTAIYLLLTIGSDMLKNK